MLECAWTGFNLAVPCLLRYVQVGQDGGEDLLASWPDGAEPFSSITVKVMQHLDNEGLTAQQAMQLTGAAFIPVAYASRLVAPQQLFLRLGGAALAPFAWEVPGQFVAHAALLKLLGVKEEPRAEDLVRTGCSNPLSLLHAGQGSSTCCHHNGDGIDRKHKRLLLLQRSTSS